MSLRIEVPPRPPIGLIPKRTAKILRAEDIQFTIMGYFEAEKKIPIEWVEEYNELVGELYAV